MVSGEGWDRGVTYNTPLSLTLSSRLIVNDDPSGMVTSKPPSVSISAVTPMIRSTLKVIPAWKLGPYNQPR